MISAEPINDYAENTSMGVSRNRRLSQLRGGRRNVNVNETERWASVIAGAHWAQ